MAVSFYMIKNFPSAPPPSIGFPDYIYPDEATCQMYDGVPCTQDASLCCYNTEKWCPDESNCTLDNGGEMRNERLNQTVLCSHLVLTSLSLTATSIPHRRSAFIPKSNDGCSLARSLSQRHRVQLGNGTGTLLRQFGCLGLPTAMHC